ncbi:uncharacterized protein LOC100181521 [Ciona intestinalis]
MFQQKHYDVMKVKEEKTIKENINNSLSSSVKQLQQECALRSDDHVTSESYFAQTFVSVVEAAFIHGLKKKYFERRKHNQDLPRPQFWNLIGKISHRGPIEESKKLKLILTNVGRCRAWLRIVINNGDLSFYLSSILTTAEYLNIFDKYYEDYALFKDHEQADIFLRYLHGADSLTFNLSCNSSILNSWTKTPLEVARVIHSSNNRRPNNNYVVSGNHDKYTMPGKPERLSYKEPPRERKVSRERNISRDRNTTHEKKPREQDIERAIESMTSQISASLPTNQLRASVDLGETPLQRNILYSRTVVKRRKSRNLRAMSEDYGSWGSLSSGISTTSTPCLGIPRGFSHSPSFSGGSPEEESSFPDLTPTRNVGIPPNQQSTPLLRHNEDNGLSQLRESPITSPQEEEFPDMIISTSTLCSEKQDMTFEPTGSNLDEVTTFEPKDSPHVTPVTVTLDLAESTLDPVANYDPVDIYSRTSDSFCETPCSPVSPSQGNSLMCGVGWSSHTDDVINNDVIQCDVIDGPPVTSQPPTREHTMASMSKEVSSQNPNNSEEFVILNQVEVEEAHLLGSTRQSSMLSHMTTIANEIGLDAQNFQCAECSSPIGIIYGTPRLCYFTGEYYCSHCHLMEEHMIPARIVHNWDFKKYPVAKKSMIFLTQQWKDPCITMNVINPTAYRYLDEMKRLLPLRLKLTSLQPYLRTCRLLDPTMMSQRLKGLTHMLGDPHLYTPNDLCLTSDGTLYNSINKVVLFGTKHVRQCQLCTAKGFVCEICTKDEVIFAFDDITMTCEECKSVYHKRCFTDHCPRCERRHARMNL